MTTPTTTDRVRRAPLPPRWVIRAAWTIHRAIYALTLDRLGGVRPEECVFVDDLDVNCDTARALGMAAVRFESAEQAIPEIESALSGQ